MNFQQDWLMRQIEAMVQVISRMVFHKDDVKYEIFDETNQTQADMLYNKIKTLLADLKICEAENLLFINMEKGNQEYLKLALDFYQTVGKLSDAELEVHNFSRQEIAEGLKDFIRKFGIVLPEIG